MILEVYRLNIMFEERLIIINWYTLLQAQKLEQSYIEIRNH
jgi:hypothetical protein